MTLKIPHTSYPNTSIDRSIPLRIHVGHIHIWKDRQSMQQHNARVPLSFSTSNSKSFKPFSRILSTILRTTEWHCKIMNYFGELCFLCAETDGHIWNILDKHQLKTLASRCGYSVSAKHFCMSKNAQSRNTGTVKIFILDSNLDQ